MNSKTDYRINVDSKPDLKPVSDAAHWYPEEFAIDTSWKFQLTSLEIDGLRFMASAVRKTIGDDANALLPLNRVDFELGPFAATLMKIYSVLRDGLGVVLVRGLPVDQMEPIDTAIIYWAIGKHLGEASPNNPDGDMLGQITDLGKTQKDANSRGYQTREAMDYHCDQCDIVGLLCIRTAKCGGISKVASSVAMYNALLTENPRFTALLAEPLYWSKHGEYPPGELPFYQSPVFNFLNGQLCTSFGPKHIYKGYDLPGTPELEDETMQAIKRAEEIADDLHYAMELECGDIQFVNNYVSLHTRSAFIDHKEKERKRLLWRLWLMRDGLRGRTGYSRQWVNGVSPGTARPRIRI